MALALYLCLGLFIIRLAWADSGAGDILSCSISSPDPPKRFNYTTTTTTTGKSKGTVLTYYCDDGFLLYGDELRTCENGSWSEEPVCEPRPKANFKQSEVAWDMKERRGNLIVVFSVPAVLPCSVEVYIPQNKTATAKAGEDFWLKDNSSSESLTFYRGDKSHNVTVNMRDTLHSGISKNFTMCLRILDNSSRVALGIQTCATVTINNSHKTDIHLLEDTYIFTNSYQTLSFLVGYRTCPISLSLSLNDSLYSTDIKIAEDCGSERTACHVDLLQLQPPLKIHRVNTSGFEVGSYRLLLTPQGPGGDCAIQVENLTATVLLTYSPEEIMKNGTMVSFSQKNQEVVVNVAGDGVEEKGEMVAVVFQPRSTFIFRLVLAQCADGKQLPGNNSYIDVEPKSIFRMLNMSSSLLSLSKTSCDMSNKLQLSLQLQTQPSVAVVGSVPNTTLTTYYRTTVIFQKTLYEVLPNGKVDVVIETSRCLNETQYFNVTLKSGSLVRVVPVANSPTMWVVNSPPIPAMFEDLELLLKVSKEFPYLSAKDGLDKTTLRLTKMKVEFGGRVATGNKGAPIFVPISISPPLPCHYKHIFSIDISGSNSGALKCNSSQWSYHVKNLTDFKLNIKLQKDSDRYVTVGENDKFTFTVPETEPAPTMQTESGVPISFTTVILVFIAVLAVGVVAYIGYSRRQQIVAYIRSADGEESKAGRTLKKIRTRTRAAYKKLPTSVQDAMKRDE